MSFYYPSSNITHRIVGGPSRCADLKDPNGLRREKLRLNYITRFQKENSFPLTFVLFGRIERIFRAGHRSLPLPQSTKNRQQAWNSCTSDWKTDWVDQLKSVLCKIVLSWNVDITPVHPLSAFSFILYVIITIFHCISSIPDSAYDVLLMRLAIRPTFSAEVGDWAEIPIKERPLCAIFL